MFRTLTFDPKKAFPTMYLNIPNPSVPCGQGGPVLIVTEVFSHCIIGMLHSRPSRRLPLAPFLLEPSSGKDIIDP